LVHLHTAQVSVLLNKPHFAFTDTEHAKISNLIVKLFSKYFFTPTSYKKNFGKKHIRFNGYMELCYLHPNYFTPDSTVLDMIGVKKGEKYVILRFVSWNASHDFGHSGLSLDEKRKAVLELSKHAKVFILSEGELPEDLKKYQIKIHPEKIHDIMAYASYFFGESGTMVAESAIMGVPSIQISGLPAGTIGSLEELEKKYELIKIYENFNEEIIDEIIDNINNPIFKDKISMNRKRMLDDKIDVTKYMINFVRNLG